MRLADEVALAAIRKDLHLAAGMAAARPFPGARRATVSRGDGASQPRAKFYESARLKHAPAGRSPALHLRPGG